MALGFELLGILNFFVVVIIFVILAQCLSSSVVLDLLLFVRDNIAMTKWPCYINLHVTRIVYYRMKKHNIMDESII